MKNLYKIAFIFFAIALFLACQTDENMLTDSKVSPKKSDQQIYKSVGVIKKVDAEKGEITIDHEDIPGYMSAMQMTEPVADKNMLDSIKADDKVEFEIERTGADVIFIKLNKIGEVSVLSGGEIYKENCAKCHSASGEGAEKGISLIKGHALHHSETEYIEQVKNGKDLQKNVKNAPEHQH